jgi:hypothetical protein
VRRPPHVDRAATVNYVYKREFCINAFINKPAVKAQVQLFVTAHLHVNDIKNIDVVDILINLLLPDYNCVIHGSQIESN